MLASVWNSKGFDECEPCVAIDLSIYGRIFENEHTSVKVSNTIVTIARCSFWGAQGAVAISLTIKALRNLANHTRFPFYRRTFFLPVPMAGVLECYTSVLPSFRSQLFSISHTHTLTQISKSVSTPFVCLFLPSFNSPSLRRPRSDV